MKSKVTHIPFHNSQEYDSKDTQLINSVELQRKFGLPEDYIELHVYDLNSNILSSNYNYTGYKSLLSSLPSPQNLLSTLTFDAAKDSDEAGYGYGSTILDYNIFRNLFGSSLNNKFFIKDISTDRTELRVTNNNIPNALLEQSYNDFIVLFNSELYYKDFYLNFGSNNLLIGVNIILEQNVDQFNLLIKLYEPLPAEILPKDQFWFIDQLSDTIAYQVDFELEEDTEVKNNYLRGPNFDIKINNEVNPSINYINYNSIFSSTSTSSYQQIKSLIEEKSLDINVDYTDYNDFIHFSSAKERLLNFIYKLKLIEGYNADYSTLSNVISTPQISSSKAIISNNINNIIEKFDGYEYYLYYESGSKAWPKKNTTQPYINYETTSSAALIWVGDDDSKAQLFGGQINSASVYDKDNQDNLFYSIPEYLRIDAQNESYETFVYMIGQHFDNIWLYSKNVTTLYDAQNNLYKGVSKDLVSYALKSLGIKLYSNTNTTSDIFSYLLGVTPSGSYLNSTGSELITTYVTASSTSLMGSEIDKEVFKRLYHNLPYLLKTKGTERGLRALISCYGIPDTILRINEFGGSDKTSTNFEQYFERVSYALNTKTGSVNIVTPWAPSQYQNIILSDATIVPDTIEFRFKTNGLPNSSSLFSQSLFQVDALTSTQFGVQLLFTSASNSGSYSKYGDLRLVMSGTQGYVFSSPIHLPFYEGWWNVMIQRETGSLASASITDNNTYRIYAANSIYNGHDGESIGFIGSSSLFIEGAASSSYNRSWNTYNKTNFRAYLGGANNNNIISTNGTKFSGFFQELRYWATPLNIENFKAHALNPSSIEGLNETSSYSKLIYRLPLGNDLYLTGSTGLTGFEVRSVHPSGSSFIMNSGLVSYGIISSSFTLTNPVVYESNTNFGANSEIVYTANYGINYLKSGNMGLSKPTNDKIRIDNNEIASGSVLSRFTKLEQEYELDLTKDVNTLEVVFSPQDQINNDIVQQLGYFDIDEYIGDPREASLRSYPNLENLSEFYFQKYLKSYNLFDFMRLIKYYNNSLFKMVKDFVPARSNTSTGILIKPHILERSKYQRSEPIVSTLSYSESIDMIDVYGAGGGVFKSSSNYNFNESIPTISGSVLKPHNNKWEVYTGELSGSRHTVTDQSLQDNIYLDRRVSMINSFNHSDYNILLNNYSSSVTSNKHFIYEDQSAIQNSIEFLPNITFLQNTNFTSSAFWSIYATSSNMGLLNGSWSISGGYAVSHPVGQATPLFYQDIPSGYNKVSIHFNYYLSGSASTNIHIMGRNIITGDDDSIFFDSSPSGTTGNEGVYDYVFTASLVNYDKIGIYAIRVNNSRSFIDLLEVTNDGSYITGSENTYVRYNAPVQDSNYTLARNTYPRYNGSKTTSRLYNTYTDGDSSYGKTAAIDKNTRKLGLFTNISSSVFFPNKSEISLKYLVDEKGNLTELNNQNKRWFEVQNLFRASEILTVAQLDQLKFGDQKRLNGEKIIFNSGYSYLPLLYFSSSDSNLYFTSENDAVRYFSLITPPLLELSGSTMVLNGTFPEPTDTLKFINYFNTASSDEGNNTLISPTSSYIIPIDGIYSFNVNIHLGAYFYDNVCFMSMSLNNPSNYPVEYYYWTRNYGGPSIDDDPQQYLSLNSGSIFNLASASFTIPNLAPGVGILRHSFSTSYDSGLYSGPSGSTLNSAIYSSSIFSSSLLFTSASLEFSFYKNGVPLTSSGEIKLTLSSSQSGTVNYDKTIVTPPQFFKAGDVVKSAMFRHNLSNFVRKIGPTGIISTNVNGIVDIPQVGNYDEYPVTIFDRGSMISLAFSNPLIILSSSLGSFIQSVGSSSLTLTSSIANVYYSSSYISNSSSLYPFFGDVNNLFSASVNDALIIKSTDGINQYELSRIYREGVTGSLVFEINGFFNSLSISNISYILLLKKERDETNAIINFNKQKTPTSYGFIIPNNIHPDIMDNIDTITKEVKTKLLEINNT